MDSENVVEHVLDSGKIDLYGDSAEFYDLTYSKARGNGSKERTARKYLSEGDKVLDLACGTGIVTERLEDDYDVTGVDISRDMIEVARNKDLESDFIQADMTDLPFHEEFDAVLMYGQPFSHLRGPEEVESAAESIYEVLNPEGVLVTDVFHPEASKKNNIDPIEIEAGDYTISMFPEFSDYDPSEQAWNGSIRFKIQSGQMITVLEDSHRFRGYSIDEMEDIMLSAGFDGVEEEKIFKTNLNQGFIAYKGAEPETTSELGFFL